MNTETARQQMVEQQIRTWDVFDPGVLDAFQSTPKDRFVPADCTEVAYADTEIPLPNEQCMLRPSIVGRILQSVDIKPSDELLEIGTGTGYLTACLSKLAASVLSIDIYAEFIEAARVRLADVDARNTTLECMDAAKELPVGPFDVVVMTASVPTLDERFVNLLKPGGRLFVVIGDAPLMRATLITRGDADETIVETRFETNVPRLVADWSPPDFLF
jgi:protein-L-isoaspartate(D-aspartate) O-methyltransferase